MGQVAVNPIYFICEEDLLSNSPVSGLFHADQLIPTISHTIQGLAKFYSLSNSTCGQFDKFTSSKKNIAMKPLLHLLFSLLILGVTHVSATCYNPDGSVTSQDVPCSSGHESSCCHPGWACLSNGLCQNPSAPNDTVGYIRGSCTDESWRSGYCPNFCVHGNPPWNDSLGKPQPLSKCANTTDDIYYCDDGNVQAVDCSKHQNVVSFVGTYRQSIVAFNACTFC